MCFLLHEPSCARWILVMKPHYSLSSCLAILSHPRFSSRRSAAVPQDTASSLKPLPRSQSRRRSPDARGSSLYVPSRSVSLSPRLHEQSLLISRIPSSGFRLITLCNPSYDIISHDSCHSINIVRSFPAVSSASDSSGFLIIFTLNSYCSHNVIDRPKVIIDRSAIR